MKTQRIGRLDCIRKAANALRQSKRMIHRGYTEEQIELVRAASREWHRRADWAANNGGIWDSFHYESEKWDQENTLKPCKTN